jgi:phosphatidylserine decarboxylase
MIYHPDTDEVIPEKQPLQTWLKNWLLFNPLVECFDWAPLVRRRLRAETTSSRDKHLTHESVLSIPAFVDFYSIDMTEFVIQHPLLFKSFNDFFTRSLQAGSRRADTSPSAVSAVADSRLLAFDSISQARELYFRAPSFGLEKMTDYQIDVRPFSGACANFRLAPQDYHHFHSPFACTVREIIPISGEDFTTETVALTSRIDVLGVNERTVVVLEGKGISCVLIAVGAEAVGKVHLSVQTGDVLATGDEMGHFEYGGSDIFLAFTCPVTWSEDVSFYTRQRIETMTRALDTVGNAVPTP